MPLRVISTEFEAKIFDWTNTCYCDIGQKKHFYKSGSEQKCSLT